MDTQEIIEAELIKPRRARIRYRSKLTGHEDHGEWMPEDQAIEVKDIYQRHVLDFDHWLEYEVE